MVTALLQRVSTGILKLDKMLGGGFIQGRTYLIAGETGAGKTILALQFLRDGLLRNEPCVYVSLDERVGNVLTGAETLGWNFWPYVKNGLFYPFEIRLEAAEVRKYGKESKAFIEAIRKVTRGGPISRIVLDPVSALAMGAKEEFYVREYLREVITYLEEVCNATTLLVTDIPTGSNRLSRFGYEEFLASGVIVMGITRLNGKLVRTIYVRKMRWSQMDPTIYTFEIQSGFGIVIKQPLDSLISKPTTREVKAEDEPGEAEEEQSS